MNTVLLNVLFSYVVFISFVSQYEVNISLYFDWVKLGQKGVEVGAFVCLIATCL